MKATPLQQLILKLVDKQDEHSFNTEYNDGVRRGLALAIVNARELLKEEKEVIVDAYEKGSDNGHDWYSNPSGGNLSAEVYFKETYQNKEDV